ncbi:MAG: PD40 domain-containing protein [Burkholderiales bacterium]|nr:PD40 domain-containing protein [Anaerolineae bacterium]
MVTLLSLLVIVSAITGHRVLANDADGDLLVYSVPNGNGGMGLFLYDVRNRRSAPIIVNNTGRYSGFVFSSSGRLAYSANDDVYVMDVSAESSLHVNLTETLDASAYPLDWNVDENYLAYEAALADDSRRLYIWDGETSLEIAPSGLPATAYTYGAQWSFDNRLVFTAQYGDDKRIYVWDGETTIDITPSDLHPAVRSYHAEWSQDGRLAFMVWYESAFDDRYEGDPSEIYVWDGETTMNVSQHPTGGDRSPSWSRDGRLAFLTYIDGNGDDSSDILVWNGQSFVDGLPDKSSYSNIVPELTSYISYPIWTNDDLLTFVGPEGHYGQDYVWDGQTATNISQLSNLHAGTPRWSADGRWAFFSSQSLVIVRDAENNTLLSTEGQYAPAWSPNGYLMFCKYGWVLTVWDGHEVIEIAHGMWISAQWQDGKGVSCSSG